MKRKNYFLIALFLLVQTAWTQQKEEVNNLIAEGNELHQKESFINAEAEYRKALSKDKLNNKAQYNLGNSLYRSSDFDQASQRYFLTQKNSENKEGRHLAFHNLGNTFMQKKDYPKAVEAYKNALRNNPTDDQTRYNYALAKELLEKENQNQDQQDQEDQKDQQDQKDQEKENENQEGDQKKKPSDDGEDEGDQDQKDPKEDEEKGDQEKENPKNKKDEKKEGENKKPLPPRKPGQLSPEQVKSLLEAMNQQEKNVQDKVNAEKVKGVPIKTKKDW